MTPAEDDLIRQLDAGPLRPDSARLAVDWRELPAAVGRAFPSSPDDARRRSMTAKLYFAIGSSAGECSATVVLQLEDARYVQVEVGVFPSPRAAMAAMRYHYAWRPGMAARPLMPGETYARPSEPLGDHALLYRSRDYWQARWVFGNALVHVASSQVDVWAGALAIQRFLSTAGIEHAPPAQPRFRLEPARVQPGDRFLATLHAEPEEPRVASPPRYDDGMPCGRSGRFCVDDAGQPLSRWQLISVTGSGPMRVLDDDHSPVPVPAVIVEAVGAGAGELRFELGDVATLSTVSHTAAIDLRLSPDEIRARDAFARACARGEPVDLEAAIDAMAGVDKLVFLAANGLEPSRLADVVAQLATSQARSTLIKLVGVFGKLALDDRSRQRILAQLLAATMIEGDDAAQQQILREVPAEVDVTWATLAYNLACSAARSGDRARMLRFVRRALLLWKEPQQFLDDPDFAPYLQDRAFRRLLALDP